MNLRYHKLRLHAPSCNLVKANGLTIVWVRAGPPP